MVDFSYIKKLMNCFPGSVIDHDGYFVAYPVGDVYFKIDNCETELDVKCKVIEWLSRDAFKTEPYASSKKNFEFQKFILAGINQFLETNFLRKI